MMDWVINLKLLKRHSSFKEEFLIFFEFLELNDLMCPLKITQRNSKFGEQMEDEKEVIHIGEVSEDHLKQSIHYYHPFQFFQLIAYYFSFKTYHYIKESKFYYFSRIKWLEKNENDEKIREKRVKRIEKEERIWIKTTNKKLFRGFNKTVARINKLTKKEKRGKKKKNINDLKEANKKLKAYEDFFYPKLIGNHFLTQEFLNIWIKLDSMIYYRDYIITPPSIRISHIHAKVSPYNEKERYENFLKFKKWQESTAKNIRNIISEEDCAKLKNFMFNLDRVFSRDDNSIIDGLDNWKDLLDIIAVRKKEEITGWINIAMNILSIKRFLGEISWALFKYNIQLWPKNQENEKPYYFISDETEILEYRKSTLSEFKLFIAIPFILAVEGETEKNIMEFYFNRKPMFIAIDVENIGGVGNTIYYRKLVKDIKERDYYFFIDYENPENYQKKLDFIQNDGVFFFPDFVTENFTVEQILNGYSKWIKDLGGNLSTQNKGILYQRLNDSKVQSVELISASKKDKIIKGFENILIDFTQVYYPELIKQKYPEHYTDSQQYYLSKKKLKQNFKKIFTEKYLLEIVRTSLEVDPERKSRKFAFEYKLEPFYKKINKIIYRNIDQQFHIL